MLVDKVNNSTPSLGSSKRAINHGMWIHSLMSEGSETICLPPSYPIYKKENWLGNDNVPYIP
ncbi:hypothetical protein HI914_02886 [Erysiphe necator]|nr:hypothetical protein HI914_02886 [Erysiphe necator]